ncbi:MAG: hypothetical protein PHC98_00185 [Syntrophotalea acetylenica]|nr:hypothetical protein [Syntrophotalea acetylenica]
MSINRFSDQPYPFVLSAQGAVKHHYVQLEKQLAARDKQLVQREELIAQRNVQIADKDGVIQELAEKVELLKAWYFAKRSGIPDLLRVGAQHANQTQEANRTRKTGASSLA